MFSFHRPKVYRSPTGCCICKAKSSSSRFTDSKKYEEDFLPCFRLGERRFGEICNACVLLVKRYKKLPPGSDRHWAHVVDARAGPGMKSISKFKAKNKINADVNAEKQKNKKLERACSPALSEKSEGNDDVEMRDVNFLNEEMASNGSSRTTSPGASDCEDNVAAKKGRRSKGIPKKRIAGPSPVVDFVDRNYWTKETICCGVIFRGLGGEMMVDERFYKPCAARLATCKLQSTHKADPENTDNNVTKLFSDNSSDSGYDDSSNPGAVADSAFTKEHVSIGELNSQTQNN